MGFFGDAFSVIGRGLSGAIGGALSGGLPGAFLGAAGGALSAGGDAMQNASARAAAREQMAFQERMSSTAWQRGVEDMRKAGINPIMAASQGPASSPGGSQAQVPGNPLRTGVSSAREIMETWQSRQLQKSQIAANSARVAKDSADTAFRTAQTAAEFGSAFKGGSLYAAAKRAAMGAAEASAGASRAAGDVNVAKREIYEMLRPMVRTSARGMKMLMDLIQ